MNLHNPDAGKAILTPSQKLDLEQRMYERWREDKPTFARQVLGYTTLKPFQAHMMRFRGEQHMGRQIALRLLPRDSGKSWGGTIASSIHDVCCGTDKVPVGADIRLQICAEALDTSMMFLGEVKQQFENNENLRRYYGEHYNPHGTWSAKKIVSLQRRRISKEPTIEAVGAGGAIVGRHVDGRYMDDIVSDRTSDSDLKRTKLRNWYDKMALPVVEQGGFDFMNGTRYFDEDMYGTLLKRYGKGILFRVPALIIHHTPEGTVYKSYFPERYPVQTLLDLRKANPITFASQYQNDTGLLVTGIIDRDSIKIIDSANWPDFGALNFYIGVDPASSTKKNADYFSTCTIGYNPLINKIYVFRSTMSRLGDPDSMFKKILNEWLWVRSNGGDVAEISLEVQGFQDVLKGFWDANPAEYGMLPIIPKNTPKDKTTRLIAQAHWFNLGNVIFDEDCIDLVTQILKFPEVEKDDDVDSCLHAIEALNNDASAGYVLPTSAYELGDTNAMILGFGDGGGGFFDDMR